MGTLAWACGEDDWISDVVLLVVAVLELLDELIWVLLWSKHEDSAATPASASEPATESASVHAVLDELVKSSAGAVIKLAAALVGSAHELAPLFEGSAIHVKNSLGLADDVDSPVPEDEVALLLWKALSELESLIPTDGLDDFADGLAALLHQFGGPLDLLNSVVVAVLVVVLSLGSLLHAVSDDKVSVRELHVLHAWWVEADDAGIAFLAIDRDGLVHTTAVHADTVLGLDGCLNETLLLVWDALDDVKRRSDGAEKSSAGGKARGDWDLTVDEEIETLEPEASDAAVLLDSTLDIPGPAEWGDKRLAAAGHRNIGVRVVLWVSVAAPDEASACWPAENCGMLAFEGHWENGEAAVVDVLTDEVDTAWSTASSNWARGEELLELWDHLLNDGVLSAERHLKSEVDLGKWLVKAVVDVTF